MILTYVLARSAVAMCRRLPVGALIGSTHMASLLQLITNSLMPGQFQSVGAIPKRKKISIGGPRALNMRRTRESP